MADEVNPRIEADAQIARALQIVCDADCTLECLEKDPGNGHRPDCQRRDYTPDELETLFFALGTAMTQLAKLPGGKEARERFYHNCMDQLLKRGRQDIIDDLAKHKDSMEEAKTHVRKAFGDNVDFAPGTSGYAMAKVIELELNNLAELREKITALADSMTLR